MEGQYGRSEREVKEGGKTGEGEERRNEGRLRVGMLSYSAPDNRQKYDPQLK